jgi:hypothetical protein
MNIMGFWIAIGLILQKLFFFIATILLNILADVFEDDFDLENVFGLAKFF